MGIITLWTTARRVSSASYLFARLAACSRAWLEGSEPSSATRIFLYISAHVNSFKGYL
jgi:hypothetical protein